MVKGSNPGTVYWIVVSEASYYNLKLTKIKVAKCGKPKKYVYKSLESQILILALHPVPLF